MGFMNGAGSSSVSAEESLEIVGWCGNSHDFKPSQSQIQDKRVFLLRASIHHDLVEHDEMDVDEAFDELIDQFLHIAFPLPESDVRYWAEALWSNPGWGLAAIEYREHRPDPAVPRCIRRLTSKQRAVGHG